MVWLNQLNQVQFGNNFQLLAAEYLRETDISIFISHLLFLYLICSLDAMKKASKKKEARIKMEIVEVLQQASYRRKRSG